MGFKPQGDGEEAMSEINVTPLVDVMLVLVIILLVTAPLLTQSVKVSLPKTAKTHADTEQQPMQLGIDAQGIITLNKAPVADVAALTSLLQKQQAAHPDTIVHIYADQNVLYAKVAQVMAAVKHAGISQLAFVTLEE